MEEIHKVLEGNVDEKEQDFNNRNTILQHYKFIDEDLNVLFKGKVAMKAVADKIIMTEFFFSGMLNELSDQELFAIFSIFATQEKASGQVADCGKMYSEKFSDAVKLVRESAETLILMEANLEVQEE